MGLSAAGGFLPPVIAELFARTDQFSAEMLKARGEMTATTAHGSSSFGKLAAVGKVAFLALGSAAVFVGVESIHMADQFEESHARLEVAIKNSGSAFDEWAGQIGTADKTMEKLGFTNAETESALASLTNATHSTDKALKDIGLAADIARGRHIELAAATTILVKVETGHVGLLGKLGINTKDATGATISQTEALRRLSEMYHGQASAYSETFSGKMKTLEATATDLGVKIGLWLIPKIEELASAFAATIDWLDRNRAAAYALAVVIGGALTVAMSAFLILKAQAAIEGIAAAWNLVTGAAGRAAAAEALAGEAGAGAGAAAGGGGILAGLGIGAIAAPVAIAAIAGIAYGLHQNAVHAQEARAAIADYLATVQRGMQLAADPVKYLDDKLVGLREKMDLLARAGSQTHGLDKAAIGFLWDQENKKYKAVLADRKALDTKATSDHTKAQAEQSAATIKALALEKKAITTELGHVAAQYGTYNENILKARNLSSTALTAIEKNVSSAVSATDQAIGSYTDIVSKFGTQTQVTSTDIIKFLSDQVTSARNWSRDMKTLAKAGIDQGLLEELYKAGPKSEGLVKGILETVGQGGKDTVNSLIAQARDVEISANKTLTSIMIQGETAWNNANAWFAAHPLTPRVIIGVSGAGAVLFNPGTGTVSGPGGVRHFAGGGDVMAGEVAQVGEKGPELVQFGRSGHVFPHGQGPSVATSGRGSGGQTNHYTINISPGLVTDPRGLGSLIVASLKAHDLSNGPIPIRVKT